MKYKENDPKGECECGHNHVHFVGDLGPNNDEEGYDLIEECGYYSVENNEYVDVCDCQKFKKKS